MTSNVIKFIYILFSSSKLNIYKMQNVKKFEKFSFKIC